MMKVCLHTHWVPLYWRSRAHSAEVRCEFQSLFQLQLAIIGQEFGSLLLLPYICFVSLPRSADDIAKFLRNVRSWLAVLHLCRCFPFLFGCRRSPCPLGPEPEQVHGPMPSLLADLAHCWHTLRTPHATSISHVDIVRLMRGCWQNY